MKIEVYPLQVIIYPRNADDNNQVRAFARNYLRWSEYYDKRQRKKVRVPMAGYVFFTNDRREVRIMRTMLNDLIGHLKMFRYREGIDFQIEYKDINNIVDDYYPTIKEGWNPRGEQQDVIDFLLGFDSGCVLGHLQTGQGKSLISMFVIEKMKERFVGIMRPQYLGKNQDSGWIKDFYKTYDIDLKKDLIRIQGSDELKSFINICLAENRNPYKAVLISSKTLMNFIKYYEEYSLEEFKDLGFNCTPQEFPKLLGVNDLVIDEAHFDHHLNCKFVSYLGAKRVFGLSATPVADDKFVDRMSKLLFPVERRYVQKVHVSYIQPIAFKYKLGSLNGIRTEGFRGYSQTAFEKSLMKKKTLLKQYYNMIVSIIEDIHFPKYEINPNFKLLITVGTIKMAKDLSKYLSELYPNKKVTSYVEDDTVDNLYTSDICVSTVLGAGTGHDIPELATVIMTNAIYSTQTNLQIAGRLRKLPQEVEHSFVYLVCDNIPSHRNYDIAKRTRIFKGKMHPVKDISYDNILT